MCVIPHQINTCLSRAHVFLMWTAYLNKKGKKEGEEREREKKKKRRKRVENTRHNPRM
jgi:hypothetical protein